MTLHKKNTSGSVQKQSRSMIARREYINQPPVFNCFWLVDWSIKLQNFHCVNIRPVLDSNISELLKDPPLICTATTPVFVSPPPRICIATTFVFVLPPHLYLYRHHLCICTATTFVFVLPPPLYFFCHHICICITTTSVFHHLTQVGWNNTVGHRGARNNRSE